MPETKLKVALIHATDDPISAVATGARRCYSALETDRLLDDIQSISPQGRAKIVSNTVSRGHTSVLEHAVFTFAIEGMSRVALAQITRHRHASFGVMSQRYTETVVDDDDFDGFTNYSIQYIIPDTIAKSPEAKKIYEDLFARAAETYLELERLGIPGEDARYVIPAGVETRLVITANARELMHFFSLRCCARAQKEMQHIANAMLREVKKFYPEIFANAGASCVQLGYCPEGKGCCGRAKTLEEIIANQRRDYIYRAVDWKNRELGWVTAENIDAAFWVAREHGIYAEEMIKVAEMTDYNWEHKKEIADGKL